MTTGEILFLLIVIIVSVTIGAVVLRREKNQKEDGTLFSSCNMRIITPARLYAELSMADDEVINRFLIPDDVQKYFSDTERFTDDVRRNFGPVNLTVKDATDTCPTLYVVEVDLRKSRTITKDFDNSPDVRS